MKAELSQASARHAVMVPPTKVDMLGCWVSKVTLEGALALVERWVQEPASLPRVIVATGFHGLWEAQKDPGFKEVVNSADLFCPDGIAPVWLSRLTGEALPERVPGPDLFHAFLARANVAGYRSFFFGDTEDTLAVLKAQLELKYPGHNIVGMLSPPFRTPTPEEDRATIEQINSTMPDVLWVGLGTPKQDWWIYRHREQLRVPVVAGVGVAFRLVAGLVKRAPHWIGHCGLEWAWRLAAEPSKLWRRDLVEGPRFLAYAISECMFKGHPLHSANRWLSRAADYKH